MECFPPRMLCVHSGRDTHRAGVPKHSVGSRRSQDYEVSTRAFRSTVPVANPIFRETAIEPSYRKRSGLRLFVGTAGSEASKQWSEGFANKGSKMGAAGVLGTADRPALQAARRS